MAGTAVVIVRVVFVDGGEMDCRIPQADFSPHSINKAIVAAVTKMQDVEYNGRTRQIGQVTVRNG